MGNFLVYESWTPPPPINLAHGSHVLNMDNFGHVAAAR